MPTRDTPGRTARRAGSTSAPPTRRHEGLLRRLFGWEYTGGEPEFGGYLNVTLNGRHGRRHGPAAGPDDPPRWTTYFATDDAAATAARITRGRWRGGRRAHAGRADGHDGHRARPAGQSVRAVAVRRHTGVQIHNEPGSLAWNEATVDDTAAAKQFYSAVFGFTFDQMDAETGGHGLLHVQDRRGPLGGLGASRPEHAEGLADLLRRDLHRRGRGRGRGEGRQGHHAGDGHPVRAVRRRRGPVGAPFEVMGPVPG